ncbi:MAG: transcriptional repressor LexA [Betaproteobacteria bacterium]|nr:transcriptional repressor LexA [Betaproteobacteria bacterium]MBI2961047.1 transcriptional repressor LexA [Betaproteobacteria bacterium]
MKSLTAQQEKILQFVRRAIEATGFPPTRAEIARALRFRSPNAAEQHLRALESKGAIEIMQGAARGLRLVEGPGIPLVGRVAAGSPVLAVEHVERRYQLDPSLFKPRADYLLRVRGMSMRDAGILDGDLLAVHRTSDVRSGQIVVARLADEVTVKRLRRRGNTVELVPENPAFKTITLDLKSEEFAIEGIGVGVIRNGRAL